MDIVSMATVFYLGQMGGEVPGMSNVILKPKAVVGIEEKLKVSKVINDIDISLFYGQAITGAGTTNNQLQEIRGEWTALYPLYTEGPESFQIGMFTSFASPFDTYEPLISFPTDAYSQEETDVIRDQLLVGADLNIRFAYDKVDTSLHNIIYVHGRRIAPNLLTFQPLYSFDWRNSFHLLGDVDHPRLKLSTDMKFWFAKKSATSVFNIHDGIGGTKREFDYELRLSYFFDDSFDAYATAYGFNNLNRGNSTNSPSGFKDGYGFGLEYRF